MENNLVLKGMKNIDGMKFHDIEGGFGEGKKAMLVKEIANIHKKEFKHINEAINKNRKRFNENVDIIDLKGTEFAVDLVDSGIYTQNSMNASKNIYLLSERGYAKLLKILEDDVAWEQYDKLVDGYFTLRAKEKSGQANFASQEDIMIYQLEEQKKIKQQLNEVNHRALETKNKVDKLDKKVDDKFGELPLFTVDSKALSKLANKKMTSLLGGKKSPAYKQLNHKGWADLYGQVHREFGVSEIGAIKRKDLEKARQVIIDYVLPTHLKEQVEIANNQIEFEEAN